MMQSVNSKANLSPASDIISALQIILRSRPIMPDLETPYSRTTVTFPNSNHCAIKLKDQSISTIITERQQQLDVVFHDISGLQTVMDGIHNLQRQLVDQKNKIIESLNLHKRLVSALWRLPTEVLSQIFHHCLPQIPKLRELDPPSKRTSPMLLTRICRRWREVALGLPSLWCELSVEVDDRNWHRAAFCYDSWLKRTRGRPLSLRLDCNISPHLTKIRHFLQPYISQISSLSIDFYDFDEPSLVMFPDFLSLEELSVDLGDTKFIYPLLVIAQSISQLFSLRSLSIHGWCFDYEDISSLKPNMWTHLTTFEIFARGQDSALHLLRLVPNLSSLTIHISFDDIHDIQVLESFTHTKLQSLHITCEAEYLEFPDVLIVSDFLDALSLPTLRVLDVRDVLEWPHEEFKAFLIRSRCPLESLVVSGVNGVTVTDEQRAEYITLAPSLQLVARGP